ncbi:MAG TPA: glycosyltransferase family 4 protein [Thermoleophilaceae bacterium]
MTALRVALLDHEASPAGDIAAALRERGHQAVVLGGRGTALDDLLARRGFTTPLTHLPVAVRELARGDHDVAHAFSPQDAYAALRWRRESGRPVVLSCTEPIERERLANGRLKLRFLRASLEHADAVIVHDEKARAAAWRWLSIEPELIPLADTAELERVYRRLIAQT